MLGRKRCLRPVDIESVTIFSVAAKNDRDGWYLRTSVGTGVTPLVMVVPLTSTAGTVVANVLPLLAVAVTAASVILPARVALPIRLLIEATVILSTISCQCLSIFREAFRCCSLASWVFDPIQNPSLKPPSPLLFLKHATLHSTPSQPELYVPIYCRPQRTNPALRSHQSTLVRRRQSAEIGGRCRGRHELGDYGARLAACGGRADCHG